MNEPTLLAWSAPDERAEDVLRQRIAEALTGPAALPSILDYLDERRDPEHGVRGAVVLHGSLALDTAVVRRLASDRAPRPVALLLDGHGAQHPRMGAQLWRTEPVFTECMDEMFESFGPDGPELRADWLMEHPLVSIDAAERGQPLLFALGYALGRTVMSWGVRPSALLGHSVGELAAAALADVISSADAMSLLATRAEAYQDSAPGGLLAVAAPCEQISGLLSGDVCVGVVNSPQQTMLAGSQADLDTVAKRLRDLGFTCVAARVPLPFHSPLMQSLAKVSEVALSEVQLRLPRIDLYSTITARRLQSDEAVDPGFWAAQVCKPVLFWPALDELLAEQDVLLLEAGPSRVLTNLARRHSAVVDGRSAVAAMLPARLGKPGADRRAVLDTAAAIWLEGHQLDWVAVDPGRASSSPRRRTGTVPPVGDILSAHK